MFGSHYVKQINGEWDHVGYLTSELVVLPSTPPADGSSAVPRVQKGTWMMANPSNEYQMMLASGNVGPAMGFTTQDISALGQTEVNAFHDRVIGKQDLPVSLGRAVSLRRPKTDAELEFEGLGAAAPGNLVTTTGTGAIAAGTFAGNKYAKLSVFNGALRLAQSGDWAIALLLRSDITPEIAGNVRIRIRKISPILMP